MLGNSNHTVMSARADLAYRGQNITVAIKFHDSYDYLIIAGFSPTSYSVVRESCMPFERLSSYLNTIYPPAPRHSLQVISYYFTRVSIAGQTAIAIINIIITYLSKFSQARRRVSYLVVFSRCLEAKSSLSIKSSLLLQAMPPVVLTTTASSLVNGLYTSEDVVGYQVGRYLGRYLS